MPGLTSVKCKQAPPRERPYKLFDEKGLYLFVQPGGTKSWRLKYRFEGRDRLLSFGRYPEVSLSAARDKRDEARARLREGLDPGANIKSPVADRFALVATEWWEKRRLHWKESHAIRVIESFKKDIFPHLGDVTVNEITSPQLLMVLRKIEARKALDLAGRMRQRCEAVFSYAIATGRCERNPAADIRGALATPKIRHYNALSAAELPAFLRALERYQGHIQTRLGIYLLLLTFVRTLELRGAYWTEIDFEGAEWRIPAERMKMGEAHVVPLSVQAIRAFQALRDINADTALVFPSVRGPERPMSENTLLYGIYRLGYHSRMTGHGVRTTASTVLNEMGFPADAIERQLAHAPRDKIRAAYNRAQYLPERRRMMQVWADYLDSLAEGGTVVPIRSK